METIDLNNYEEYLLSYIDGELEPGCEAELLKFLEAHPALKQELALLEAARLPADESIVFPGKQSLYRQSSGARVIRRTWWIAAAAAVAGVIMILYRPGGEVEVPVVRHLPVAGTAPASPGSLAADAPASSPQAPADTASAHILPATAPARREKPSEERRLAEARKKVVVPVEEPGQVSTPEPLPALDVPSPAVVTLHPLQHLPVPESGQPSPGPEPAGTAATRTLTAAGEEPAGLFSRAKSFTDSARTLTMKTEVALASAKEQLDDGITDKITGLQDRISHPFRALKGKKIRIGHLEIAMNN